MCLIVWWDWYQHKFYSWEIFSVTAWLQWLVPSADNRGWGVTVRCNSCNGSHITIFEPRSKKSKVWIVTGWKTQGHCYQPQIHFQARIHLFIIKFGSTFKCFSVNSEQLPHITPDTGPSLHRAQQQCQEDGWLVLTPRLSALWYCHHCYSVLL